MVVLLPIQLLQQKCAQLSKEAEEVHHPNLRKDMREVVLNVGSLVLILTYLLDALEDVVVGLCLFREELRRSDVSVVVCH